VYFDGGSKANLYCILRNCWKILIIVLASQNNLKTLGSELALYTSSFHRKCKFALVVGGVRGPLWRGVRLEENSQISLKRALALVHTTIMCTGVFDATSFLQRLL